LKKKSKILKRDIIKEIAKSIDLPEYKIEEVVNEFISEIAGNLSEGIDVEISKFGKFSISGGYEKPVYNINNKTTEISKISKSAKFYSASALLRLLNS